LSEEDVIWDLKDIKSKDPDVKWTAVNNLGKYLDQNSTSFRSKMIIKSFISMVSDPNNTIREIIYLALFRHLTDPKQLEALTIKGFNDSNPSIRSICLERLNTSNHPSIVSKAIKSLRDDSEAVRKTAFRFPGLP